MSQLGARTPITTILGYQEAYGGTGPGWQRLAEILTIPPEATGAIIFAMDIPGTAVHWADSPAAVLGSFLQGMTLEGGNFLVLQDATQVQGLCMQSDLVPAFTVQFFTGPRGRLPAISSNGAGGGGGGGGVQSVTGTDVDNSDPLNPVVLDVTIPTGKAIWVVASTIAMRYLPAPYDLATVSVDLQHALDIAGIHDTVVVMPGAANDEIRTITITGRKHIHLMGSGTDVLNDGLLITVNTGAELTVTGFGMIGFVQNEGTTRIIGPTVGTIFQIDGSYYQEGNVDGLISAQSGTLEIHGTLRVRPSSLVAIDLQHGATTSFFGDIHLVSGSINVEGPLHHEGTVYIGSDDAYIECSNTSARLGSIRLELGIATPSYLLSIVGSVLVIDGIIDRPRDGVSPIRCDDGSAIQLNGAAQVLSKIAPWINYVGSGSMNVYALGAYVTEASVNPLVLVTGTLNVAPWL